MNHDTKVRLLASMRAGRLALLCGAGLSMAPPSALGEREAAHMDLLSKYNIEPRFASDLDALEHEANLERNRVVELERALNSLEASRAVRTLASVESRLSSLRQHADLAGDELAKAQGAVSSAKSLEKNVRRSASEIIDERLALISPLLNELYQRLRPHSDWRSIDYSIRGDVRRFLSLRVGNHLNPQFVFSSGQRRAAGLAFLLSVHLARSWTRWQTLMLDDPVQHIDDFRALNLVEVLGALRQGGRQVIVAVEDQALADLLCRRLFSTAAQQGRRLSLDYGPSGSIEVIDQIDIPPMQVGLFRQLDTGKAVG